MPFALRGILIALIVGFMAAPQALAQELAPLIAWVGKSQQTAPVEGRVARLLGLNKDGKPMRFTAVTTAYLDGARTVHLLKSPQGDMLLFSQGKARQGQWFLTNGTGDTVQVLSMSLDGPPLRTISATQSFFFGVGAVINVGVNQPEGVYTATFDVMANYL